MIHISPEADRAREIFPHSFVFPYALFAFVYKGSNTVLLDLILSVKAEELFHLNLNGETVSIPAGFAGDIVALHGAVSRNHILDDARKNVTYVRLAVCCGGTVIKGVNL